MIFNVDETGINTDHSPPLAYAKTGSSSQAITSPRSSTTTIITCASAIKCYILSLFLRAKGLLQTYLKVHCLEQSVKCLQLDGQIVKSLKYF